MLVLESGTSKNKTRFAEGLSVQKPWDETFVKIEKTAPRCMVVTPNELKKVWPAIKACLSIVPPLYIEDNATGLGECAICGNKGVLGRCVACGLLMHYSCIGPTWL